MPGYPRSLAVSFAVILGVGLVSCDRSQLPTASPPVTPTPTPTGRSSITLSGVVFDHTSKGPLPGANVQLLVRAWGQSPTSLNVWMEVSSDAMGRYSLSGVPRGSISITAALGSGYYTPCPAGWGGVQSDRVLNVHVVSAALLSTAGAPADIPRSFPWVSGVVFELTPQGKQPIAGATVTLGDPAFDPSIGSTTLTDAGGRYVVCPPIPSHGSDTYASVRVSREGYRPASRSALLGWDFEGVDIALSRH